MEPEIDRPKPIYYTRGLIAISAIAILTRRRFMWMIGLGMA